MVIGALWYSPLLFGNTWVKEMGFTKDKMEEAKKKGMTKEYVLVFVGALLSAAVIAGFMRYLGVETPAGGAYVGLAATIGFLMPSLLNGVLWEGKSWKMYAIHVGHYLAAFVIGGALLGWWM